MPYQVPPSLSYFCTVLSCAALWPSVGTMQIPSGPVEWMTFSGYRQCYEFLSVL